MAKLRTKGLLHKIIIRTNIIFLLLYSVFFLFIIALAFAIAYYFVSNEVGFTVFKDVLYLSISTLLSFGSIDTLLINNWSWYIAIIEAFSGTIYISMFIAIIVYKFLAVSSKVIAVEDKVIFTKGDNKVDDASLRIRIMNLFSSSLIDVEIKMFLRVWIKSKGKYATWDLKLKRSLIPSMDPKVPWFIAGKPFVNVNVLDLEKEDGNRRPIVFHPSYLSEKYVPEVSEDKQIVIKLVIKGTVPELNTNVIAHKNYKLSDVICGKHKLIEPKPGFYSLKNWNKYKASKLSNCRNCSFHSNCRLTNELSDTDSNFKKAR